VLFGKYILCVLIGSEYMIFYLFAIIILSLLSYIMYQIRAIHSDLIKLYSPYKNMTIDSITAKSLTVTENLSTKRIDTHDFVARIAKVDEIVASSVNSNDLRAKKVTANNIVARRSLYGLDTVGVGDQSDQHLSTIMNKVDMGNSSSCDPDNGSDNRVPSINVNTAETETATETAPHIVTTTKPPKKSLKAKLLGYIR